MSTFEGRRSVEKQRLPLGQEHSSALQQVRDEPCITILMCTLNGGRFLSSQLASLERQTHRNWRLIVSDDGSDDATLEIVRNFAARVRNFVELRHGPRRGPAANFLSLAADAGVQGDYFAFCDQDDIWYPEKLSTALSWLKTIDGNRAAVYGGRTRLVGADAKPLGYAPEFRKSPHFSNSLVQSIAGGNTMLFNGVTKRVLEESGPLPIVSHDWWIYQLVTGAGGVFYYDPKAHLDYRQHSANHIGSNKGLRAQMKRLRAVLTGRFADWNNINIAALERSRHLLSDEANALLNSYIEMREGNIVRRLITFARSPIRRQTMIGNVALLVAIVLGRL